MKKRICPQKRCESGVCGCPEFWKFTAQPGQISSIVDINNLRTPSPKPSAPPKETCFFWYHGICRRDEHCQYAHQAHITWPIPAPPGFVHFQSCELPFCPLREDMLALKKARQTMPRTQFGGQGGAPSCRLTMTMELASSDDDNNPGADN